MATSENPVLERLKHEIQYEKLTVSFSIEGRDSNGVKKFCQFSATSSSSTGRAWSAAEMPIVKCLISKQVVILTYKDARQRGVLSGSQAATELKEVLQAINSDTQKYVETYNGSEQGKEDIRRDQGSED